MFIKVNEINLLNISMNIIIRPKMCLKKREVNPTNIVLLSVLATYFYGKAG